MNHQRLARHAVSALLYAVPVLSVFASPVLNLSSFWVNDDVGNLLWLSGGFSGSPEYQNPVLGLPIGVLISMLYRVTGEIAWYPLALLVVPLAAFLLLLKYLRGRLNGSQLVVVAVLANSCLFLLGTLPNYTYASFVACAASMTLLGIHCHEKRLRVRYLFAPIALSILALSLRSNWMLSGFGLPQPFLASVVVVSVAFLPRWGRQQLQFLLRFGAITLGIWAMVGLSQIVVMQTDSEWARFIDFHGARGAVNGVQFVGAYISSSSPSDIYRETGMDSADIFETQTWFLFNAEDTSPDELRALRDSTETARSSDSLWIMSKLTLKEVLKILWMREVQMLMFSLVGYLGLIRMGRTGRSWASSRLLPAILIAMFLFAYVTGSVRSPSYVTIGLLSSVAITVLSSAPVESRVSQHSGSHERPVLTFLTSMQLAMLILWAGGGVISSRGSIMASANEVRQVLTATHSPRGPAAR